MQRGAPTENPQNAEQSAANGFAQSENAPRISRGRRRSGIRVEQLPEALLARRHGRRVACGVRHSLRIRVPGLPLQTAAHSYNRILN